MKNFKKVLVVLVITLIFSILYINKPAMSYSSESSNATKMLNYYRKQNYKAAQKYAKKLKNTKTDFSESKMSDDMIKAYVNVILNTPKKYLWGGVYFVDMDGDNKSEMILPYGTCEADVVAHVYKYKRGKTKKVGEFNFGHTLIANYPGHKGVICMTTHMGYEEVSKVYLKNKKIKQTNYGYRYVDNGKYLNLKPLNNHLTFNNKWDL